MLEHLDKRFYCTGEEFIPNQSIANTLQAVSPKTDLLYLCDSESALDRVASWIILRKRTKSLTRRLPYVSLSSLLLRMYLCVHARTNGQNPETPEFLRLPMAGRALGARGPGGPGGPGRGRTDLRERQREGEREKDKEGEREREREASSSRMTAR